MLATSPLLVRAETCDVTVALAGYSPGSLTVAAGRTVTWCWTEDDHSVTGDGFDSGVRNGGATFQRTFATEGTYGYHCSVHSAMVATVTVVAAPAETEPAPPPPMAPPPMAGPGATPDTVPAPGATETLAALARLAPQTVPSVDLMGTAPAPVIAPPPTETATPLTSPAGAQPAAPATRFPLPLPLALLGGLAAVLATTRRGRTGWCTRWPVPRRRKHPSHVRRPAARGR